MNNIKLLVKIGEGAHGVVFKALSLDKNHLVAVKKLAINPSTGLVKNVLREICALRVLKNKHIVQLLDVCCKESAIILIMEYLPCSLAYILQTCSDFMDLPKVKAYTNMIFQGLSFMHGYNIMHRDIKPANLLISESGCLKIADFGLARVYNKDKLRSYSHQVATRWYRAPELLYGSKTYTPSVDIWSAGCILVEMINKKPLFAGETDIEQLAIVIATLGSPNEKCWPDLPTLPDYNKISFTPSTGVSWKTIIPSADIYTLNLISEILIYDGQKRLAASKVLDHTFFTTPPIAAIQDTLPKSIDQHPKTHSYWLDFELDDNK